MQAAKYESAVQSAKILKRKTLSGTVYEKWEYDVINLSLTTEIFLTYRMSCSVTDGALNSLCVTAFVMRYSIKSLNTANE